MIIVWAVSRKGAPFTPHCKSPGESRNSVLFRLHAAASSARTLTKQCIIGWSINLVSIFAFVSTRGSQPSHHLRSAPTSATRLPGVPTSTSRPTASRATPALAKPALAEPACAAPACAAPACAMPCHHRLIARRIRVKRAGPVSAATQPACLRDVLRLRDPARL